MFSCYIEVYQDDKQYLFLLSSTEIAIVADMSLSAQ